MNRPVEVISETLKLYFTGKVKYLKTNLNRTISREDGKEFNIFREISINGRSKSPEAVFRVWFYSKGSNWFTSIFAYFTTLFFIGMKGFCHKIYIVDSESGELGGIYEFETLLDAENYLNSFAMKLSSLRAKPNKFWKDTMREQDSRLDTIGDLIYGRK